MKRSCDQGSMMDEMLSGSLPRYKGIKQMILARIRSGEWPADYRIPSESQLMATYGVSKMTADRALCELAREGKLTRIPRVGSFVASMKRFPIAFEMPDIANVIRLRGNVYSARIIHLSQKPVSSELADEFGLSPGSAVYHSIVVHNDDGVPVQLEDRVVLPAAAPDYLAQNFVANTPHAYLAQEMRMSELACSVQAVAPRPWECALLKLLPAEPCLSISERVLLNGAIMSVARYVCPSSRYRMKGSAKYLD